MRTTTQTPDLGPIRTDSFPTRTNPRQTQRQAPRRQTGVRFDPHEEATNRFSLAPADDHHNDTTTRTTPESKDENTMTTSTKSRRRIHTTPKSRTRKAWFTFRQAELAWREACDRYASERQSWGNPGPHERSKRIDRMMELWELLIDELAAKAARARIRVRTAIRAQRVSELRDQLRVPA